MHGTLHKPVYLKGAKMLEAPIPMRPPKTPTPPATPEPQPSITQADDDEEEHHLPMLICNLGNKIVIPHSATRDVMSGRTAFYLVDEDGVSMHKPKHIFAALKLTDDNKHKYEDYPCIGAHQRIFERRSGKRRGLGYRRFYVSDVLITRGIYVS